MSVNIFGSYGKFTKSNVDKNYVDSKFILMLKNLQLKVDKTGGIMNDTLNMNNFKIKNVCIPTDQFDAVNKEYVDSDFIQLNENLQLKAEKKYVEDLYTLSTYGLVPHFINPINATGFVVSASSELGNNHAGHKVLIPNNKTCWRVADGNGRDCWIGITCPFEVRIYRFAIQPAENSKLIKWKIQGRMDVFHLWEDLLFTLKPLLDNSTRMFTLENPKLAKGYWDYRIFIEEAEGESPGLTYWQLYTINPVYSSQ